MKRKSHGSGPEAAILSVGNEVLAGQTVNTNAAFMARLLEANGLRVARCLVLPDVVAEIVRAVKACREAVVLVTGGLGATSDDLTAEALAKAFGKKLILDAAQEARIRESYRLRGRAPAEVSLRQAWVPEGFRVLENRWGTAPCLMHRASSKRLLFAMPGVPREMRPLMTERIVPEIRRALKLPPRLIRELRIVGLGESDLYAQVKHLPIPESATLAFLPSPGEVLVRFSGLSKAVLEKTSKPFEKILHHHLVSSDGKSLEAVILAACAAKGWRLGTAESCTGGLIAARFTTVAGSSRVFDSGVVTYSNESKSRWLGVPAKTIETHGAVSRDTVCAMARGLATRRKLEGVIAVSGIAGPEGGSAEKPVGTVWIAVYWRGRLEARMHLFHGDREDIRTRAAQEGLRALWERVTR